MRGSLRISGIVAAVGLAACLAASSRARTVGPRLPFRLPTEADAEACLAARARAIGAFQAKDWDAATKELRAALEAFPDSQLDRYNLACMLAMSGDAQGAFEALEWARDVGSLHAHSVAADPDLASLHAHSAWPALLRSLSSQPSPRRAPYGAEELAGSRGEIEALAAAMESRVTALERLLGPQHAVAMGEIALWKAASLDAMASRSGDPTERDGLRWEAFRGLLDDRMNPASEYLVREVLRRASAPEMEESIHWIDVAHARAMARWGATYLDATTDDERAAAAARRRADLLEIAASVGDRPELARVLTVLAWETVDELSTSVRFYRRLMAVAPDPLQARERVQHEAPGTVLAAEGLPDLRATTTTGTTWSNAELQGRWTLLHAWGTWCPPCISALPTLRSWHGDHAGRGLALVGVAMEQGPTQDPATFARWCAERQLSWPQVLDVGPEQTRLTKVLGIKSVPQYLLINPQGTIVAAGNRPEHVAPALEAAMRAAPDDASPRSAALAAGP